MQKSPEAEPIMTPLCARHAKTLLSHLEIRCGRGWRAARRGRAWRSTHLPEICRARRPSSTKSRGSCVRGARRSAPPLVQGSSTTSSSSAQHSECARTNCTMRRVALQMPPHASRCSPCAHSFNAAAQNCLRHHRGAAHIICPAHLRCEQSHKLAHSAQ